MESVTPSAYQREMQPWPSLAPHARRIRLPVSGLSLHLYDVGPEDAPPLLLVHGLGDEADSWRHLIHPMSTSRRVLAPDTPPGDGAIPLSDAARELGLPAHSPHIAAGDALTTAQMFLALVARLDRTDRQTVGSLARLSKR